MARSRIGCFPAPVGEAWRPGHAWRRPAGRTTSVSTAFSCSIQPTTNPRDESRSKAGFVEEGIRRGANLHDDGWHDMVLYSHLATDHT